MSAGRILCGRGFAPRIAPFALCLRTRRTILAPGPIASTYSATAHCPFFVPQGLRVLCVLWSNGPAPWPLPVSLGGLTEQAVKSSPWGTSLRGVGSGSRCPDLNRSYLWYTTALPTELQRRKRCPRTGAPCPSSRAVPLIVSSTREGKFTCLSLVNFLLFPALSGAPESHRAYSSPDVGGGIFCGHSRLPK